MKEKVEKKGKMIDGLELAGLFICDYFSWFRSAHCVVSICELGTRLGLVLCLGVC